MSLGPPIRSRPVEKKAEWLPVEGKPHLRRHSITGKVATHIPANEAVNAPRVTPAEEFYKSFGHGGLAPCSG